jgi:hypothetical protein
VLGYDAVALEREERPRRADALARDPLPRPRRRLCAQPEQQFLSLDAQFLVLPGQADHAIPPDAAHIEFGVDFGERPTRREQSRIRQQAEHERIGQQGFQRRHQKQRPQARNRAHDLLDLFGLQRRHRHSSNRCQISASSQRPTSGAFLLPAP